MPKVTEEHKLARRNQILEAALNCFVRKGCRQTTMKDICKESGLSTGAVYLHFKSKEDIIEASWKMYLDARAERFEGALQTNTSPIKALGKLAETFQWKLGQSIPDRGWQLWVQLLSEAARNHRIKAYLRQSWDMMDKQWAELGRQLEERGEIEPGGDHKTPSRLWSAIHDGLILQKIIDPEQDVEKYAEAFTAMQLTYASAMGAFKKQQEVDDGLE